jgi:hypothetical protein
MLLTSDNETNDSPMLISTIEVWKGERVYLEGDFTSSDERLTVRKYKKMGITTVIPSFQEAEVKKYFDALKLVSDGTEIADITVFEIPRNITITEISLLSKNSNVSTILRILDKTLPEISVFPMYSEINSEFSMYPKVLVMGGKIEDKDNPDKAKKDQWWKLYGGLQGPQTVKTIKLARQFGIEPTKQTITAFTDGSDYGEYNYYNLVIKDAIAPPLIWCVGLLDEERNANDAKFEPDKWLKSINEIVPKDSLAYCADEPGTTGISVEQAIEIIKLVKEYAPNLRPMVTAVPDEFYKKFGAEKIKELEIVFAPVQNLDDLSVYPIDLYPEKEGLRFRKGSYFSCMAQGNCSNKVNSEYVCKRTEFPVAVVEGDPIEDFQRSIRLAYENQADFVLYYMLNKRTHKCWDKSWNWDNGIGIYSEGGNGEGTAMYYDPENGDPWPSVRMMHWDIAKQQVEKEILEKKR